MALKPTLVATAWMAVITPTFAVPAPIFGAIRWDCWYNTSWKWPDPGFAIERNLGWAQWRDRTPWFCDVVGTNNITCNNNVQEIVDQEIEMAVKAGLGFWAFDTYDPSVPLSVPKHMYWNSTSAFKSKLKWAHLLQTPDIANPGYDWFTQQYVPTLVQDFLRPDYLLVSPGARPVVFLFDVIEDAWTVPGRTGWAGWAQAMRYLANATVAAGLGAPYLSAMVWSAGEGATVYQGINTSPGGGGLDAPLVPSLTSYAYTYGASFPQPGAFTAMAAASPGYWSALAGTGAQVIPPVSAGWDPRPMNQSALPWQNYTNPAFLTMPNQTELAGIVQAAIEWSASNPASNPTGLHLLSAWNEYAEGHFIAPVLPAFGGDERLQAIASVLVKGQLL